MKIMYRAYRTRNILVERYSAFYDKHIYIVLYPLPCVPANIVNTACILITGAQSPLWCKALSVLQVSYFALEINCHVLWFTNMETSSSVTALRMKSKYIPRYTGASRDEGTYGSPGEHRIFSPL